MSLATLVVFNISKEKTMKEMMDALAKLYEKTLASNKVFLMKILFNMNVRRWFCCKKFKCVDYLGWFSLMSTLEESLVANSGSTMVWVMDPSLFDG
jgi:hypothetical protein